MRLRRKRNTVSFGMGRGSARLTPHPIPTWYGHGAPIKGLSRHKRGYPARIYSTLPLTGRTPVIAASTKSSACDASNSALQTHFAKSLGAPKLYQRRRSISKSSSWRSDSSQSRDAKYRKATAAISPIIQTAMVTGTTVHLFIFCTLPYW